MDLEKKLHARGEQAEFSDIPDPRSDAMSNYIGAEIDEDEKLIEEERKNGIKGDNSSASLKESKRDSTVKDAWKS